MKTLLLVFSFLALVIIAVYGPLVLTFYQQDEWYGLGLALAEGVNSAFNGVWNPFDLLFAKGRILSSLIFFGFVNFFPFQNGPIAILAITLHIIATFLVFMLLRQFLKKTLISLLGSLFFALNAVSQGGVTWVSIAISTIISTIVILLAIIFFFKYLSDKDSKWLVVSGFLIYFSLLFKETGLYMLLFLPLSALIYIRLSPVKFIKKFWMFTLPFLLITSYRVIQLKQISTEANLYVTGLNENFYSTIILRTIFYPLTSFSLMFMPGDQFLDIARVILRQLYPFLASAPNNVLIVQTVVLDLLAILLTVFISIFIYILWRKEKVELKKVVIFWIIFSLMSFLPYVLLSKDFSYLESRYYYLSVVGGAFIFAWILKRLQEIFGRGAFYFIITPMCVLFLLLHGSLVNSKITEQINLSNLRLDFIRQLKAQVPTLDKEKNVMYISGVNDFWADGNKIPFQQGSGYTLMVLYNDSGKIPKEFLKEGFLFDIGGQGYKEAGELGFGYFWDRVELNKTISLHNLPQSSIIMLKYDARSNELKFLLK